MHVRVDERGAAFYALGIALETGMPAAVVTTSGTAPGNLLPAILEADAARVPLLLLTADRPERLRCTRSNQTTAQPGMFEKFTRYSVNVSASSFTPAGGVGAGDGGSGGAGQNFEERECREDRAGMLAGIAATAWGAACGVAVDPRESVDAKPAVSAGPVHINIEFDEPLSQPAFAGRVACEGAGPLTDATAGAAASATAARPDSTHSTAARTETVPALAENQVSGTPAPTFFTADTPTVVIAGAGAGPAAEQFAHSAGFPLLAEVVSGSRYGRELIACYETLLAEPLLGGRVRRAIVFGHPTLGRQIPLLMERLGENAFVVDRNIPHYDPARTATRIAAARMRVDATSAAKENRVRANREWLGQWIMRDRELLKQRTTVHEPNYSEAASPDRRVRSAYARTELKVTREPVTREMLVESVWRATWPHDRLVIGASRLIRVLDALAPARKVRAVSNRGLAGIDGTLATALGVAAASQDGSDMRSVAGVTRVLLGDLSLLHDAGSMLLAADETRPHIQVFCGNDGGGSIFDTLEAAEIRPDSGFDRAFFTPHSVSLAALAEAYGWKFTRVATRGELQKTLTGGVSGPELVEVPLKR